MDIYFPSVRSSESTPLLSTTPDRPAGPRLRRRSRSPWPPMAGPRQRGFPLPARSRRPTCRQPGPTTMLGHCLVAPQKPSALVSADKFFASSDAQCSRCSSSACAFKDTSLRMIAATSYAAHFIAAIKKVMCSYAWLYIYMYKHISMRPLACANNDSQLNGFTIKCHFLMPAVSRTFLRALPQGAAWRSRTLARPAPPGAGRRDFLPV